MSVLLMFGFACLLGLLVCVVNGRDMTNASMIDIWGYEAEVRYLPAGLEYHTANENQSKNLLFGQSPYSLTSSIPQLQQAVSSSPKSLTTLKPSHFNPSFLNVPMLASFSPLQKPKMAVTPCSLPT